MTPRQLIKLNELPILWVTPCEKCGKDDFTIIELKELPLMYIAKVKCKNCGMITKMELNGDELSEKIAEIKQMEDKVIFERDEFVVKENDVEYFIEFKTDLGAVVKEVAHGNVIGAHIPKAKYTGR